MSTRRIFLKQAAMAGVIANANSGFRAPAIAGDIPRPPKGRMATCRIPQTDLVVSRIAYGCAYLVNWDNTPLSEDAIAKANHLINTAYDDGITFFDQGDRYGLGKSEQVLGEALKRSPGLRNKIVLQSKSGMVFPNEPPPGPFRLDCSYDHLIHSVENSLRRLGTDRLDLFLLHWPDPLANPDEIAKAFEELKRGGKVRYFGVSNHSIVQIELLQKSVRLPLVTNQIPLGLARPDLLTEGFPEFNPPTTPLAGTVDFCRLHDLQVQAYSPLRGVLLNPPDNAPAQTKEAAKTLADMAADKHVPPSALAIAWLLQHPAGIIPVIGSTNPAHVTENCAGAGLTLTRSEWYTLYAAASKMSR